MDQKRLFDLLSGSMAYDAGATDSGIDDPEMRAEVLTYIGGLSNQQQKQLLVDFVSDEVVTDDQYTVEDIAATCTWFFDFISGVE